MFINRNRFLHWLIVPGLASSAWAARVTIQPADTVMGLGGTGFVNVLYDDDDDGPNRPIRVDPSSITWASSQPGTVLPSVGLPGAYTALAEGEAQIWGTYLGLAATGTVRVAGRVVSGSLVTPGDGRTRTYIVFVPSRSRPESPLPLVLSFHGGFGTANVQMSQSQLLPVAERENFLVAFPNGTGLFPTWNGGLCCGYAVDNGVDDVGFVRALVQRLKADYAVDAERVYATGMSNGGILSHRLACEAADVFAAIAPVAGGLNVGGDFPSCLPSRKVSVLQFHGATDDNYPFLGGVGNGYAGVSFYPIPDTISDWLALNGVARDPRVFYRRGIETCEVHAGFPDDVRVGLCLADPPVNIVVDGVTLDGGGHAWPGGTQPSAGSDAPTTDASAAELIWAFFQEHPASPAVSARSARAFPNPFRPELGAVVFDRMPAGATLEVFDLKGTRRARLTADGHGRCVWDVRSDAGEPLGSGVYFVRVTGGGERTLRFVVER